MLGDLVVISIFSSFLTAYRGVFKGMFFFFLYSRLLGVLVAEFQFFSVQIHGVVFDGCYLLFASVVFDLICGVSGT